MNEQQLFRQQKKGSLLWLWILLTVVGGIVFIVVAFFVLYYILIAGAFLTDRPGPTTGDAWNATRQYYKAIQNHDYATASNYLVGQLPSSVALGSSFVVAN